MIACCRHGDQRGKWADCQRGLKVHSVLGPGLLESVYEYFLARELRKAGFHLEQQKPIPVEYLGETVDLGFRPDLIVNREVIVEIKTVHKLVAIHEAQLLSYMRLANIERGLLINFHTLRLVDGIKRLSLTKSKSYLGDLGDLGG